MAKTIASLDSETDPFRPGRTEIAPFIWGLYNGQNLEYFENSFRPGRVEENCTEKLVMFLRECDWIVYAHNGGKFDYHFLFPWIDPWQPIKIINGRIASFKIGKCEFRDSFNILPIPLASYQKDEIDYSIMERGERYKPENYQAIKDYLAGDVHHLYELVTRFIDEYGRHLTIAGASMKQWEEIYDVKAPRSTQKYYDTFKPYYYGGRVQCFEHGFMNRHFKMADINSAYPTAMLDPHPISTQYNHMTKPPRIVWEKYLQRSFMGNCFFTVWARSWGAFPYRASDGGLYFPEDGALRQYHVTGWEMQTALDTDTARIEDVTDILEFDVVEDFSEYINHFYYKRQEAKKKGDKARDIFCKLFMNSLYGKFGSEPRNYSEYLILPEDFFDPLLNKDFVDMEFSELLKELDFTDEEIELAEQYGVDEYDFGGSMGDRIVGAKDLEGGALRYYNIATAASITGWVRAFLWRHICQTQKPLYCDTDSIAGLDFHDFEFSDRLGAWEIEGEFDRAAIAGRKMYAFHYTPEYAEEKGTAYKTASKGVKLAPEEIERVALGEQVEHVPMAPTFSLVKKPQIVKRNVTMTVKRMPENE